MSQPPRRFWPPFNQIEFWRLALALVALFLGMLFVLALSWLFLHYQQQQLLAQVLGGAALLLGGVAGGLGLSRRWQQIVENESK